MIVQHFASAPPPVNDDYYQRNEGPDQGLINAWLTGLQRRYSEPQFVERALAGELPVLSFKGGVEKAVKTKSKLGSLLYLATWHGLRGEDLDLDTEQEVERTCSKTAVTVVYTMDLNRLKTVE